MQGWKQGEQLGACCKNPLRDDDVLDQGRAKRSGVEVVRHGWIVCVC